RRTDHSSGDGGQPFGAGQLEGTHQHRPRTNHDLHRHAVHRLGAATVGQRQRRDHRGDVRWAHQRRHLHLFRDRVQRLRAGPSIQPADPLTLRWPQRWSVDLRASVSYPLIAGGKVFVITASTLAGNAGISRVVALDQGSGSVVWQQVLPYANYGFTGIAYDAGRVFAVTFTGDMTAYDAQT